MSLSSHQDVNPLSTSSFFIRPSFYPTQKKALRRKCWKEKQRINTRRLLFVGQFLRHSQFSVGCRQTQTHTLKHSNNADKSLKGVLSSRKVEETNERNSFFDTFMKCFRVSKQWNKCVRVEFKFSTLPILSDWIMKKLNPFSALFLPLTLLFRRHVRDLKEKFAVVYIFVMLVN